MRDADMQEIANSLAHYARADPAAIAQFTNDLVSGVLLSVLAGIARFRWEAQKLKEANVAKAAPRLAANSDATKPAIKPTPQSVEITFGKTPNQTTHAIRHVEAEGLSSEAVQNAILKDIEARRLSIEVGNGSIFTMDFMGRKLHYRVFQVSKERLNVGTFFFEK